MNTALLLSLAAEVGAPMIEKILGGRIGQGNAALIREVISRIAINAGGRADELEALIQVEPDSVRDAIMTVEAQSPELLALYAKELEFQMAQLEFSQSEPLWARAWRPGGMYMIGFLILWNAVILHSLNAAFKIALPPMEWATVLQLAGIYFSLYMGGHTLKDVVAKWAAKGGVS